MSNALAGLSGLLVVVLHVYVGILSEGHPVLRPIGEPTIYAYFGWVLTVALCVPILVLTRGRSLASVIALAITVTSAVLVLAR
jgi:hypothetical protein